MCPEIHHHHLALVLAQGRLLTRQRRKRKRRRSSRRIAAGANAAEAITIAAIAHRLKSFTVECRIDLPS